MSNRPPLHDWISEADREQARVAGRLRSERAAVQRALLREQRRLEGPRPWGRILLALLLLGVAAGLLWALAARPAPAGAAPPPGLTPLPRVAATPRPRATPAPSPTPAALATSGNSCATVELLVLTRTYARLRVTSHVSRPRALGPEDVRLIDDRGASHAADGPAVELPPRRAVTVEYAPASGWERLAGARVEVPGCPALSARWP